MKSTFASLLAFTLLATQCSAGVYNTYSQVPTNVHYDYVIVGGGCAGSVLATRLSEDPSKNVLLLEAGGDNTGVYPVDVPGLVTQIPLTYYYNYTTVPGAGLNGASIFYPRGYLLGGSTNVNGMFYTRGSSEDYDRFARVTGDQGWSWRNLKQYFDKSEKWTLPADHHNITGQYDPSIHAIPGGGHAVSLQGYPDGIKEMVFTAGQQIGAPFNYNEDYNSGNLLGVGNLQSTINGATRASSAAAYLTTNIRARKNLHILLNARVSRVLPTGKNQFRGVEFTQDIANGPFHTVNATREVILSAGAVNTPQVLLNSGIGDDAYLKSVNIPTLVNLPSVGKNLSDQPSTTNMWFVNSTNTFDTLYRSQDLMAKATAERNANGTGPLIETPAGEIAWFRLPDSFIKSTGIPDPAAGPKSPHIELIFANGFYAPTDSGNFIVVSTNLVSPVARGSIKIDRSTNSFFNMPLIDPAFLTTDFDIKAQIEGVKAAFKFLTAPVWEGYVLQNTYTGATLTAQSSDADIEAFIRSSATGTSSHPVGSCSMSAKGASFGCTDPNLLVKGVQGLRIVDASVFPFSPSAHTQAVVYVFAERAADLIKASTLGRRHEPHRMH